MFIFVHDVHVTGVVVATHLSLYFQDRRRDRDARGTQNAMQLLEKILHQLIWSKYPAILQLPYIDIAGAIRVARDDVFSY